MLELTGITKSYGDQTGVDSVDLVAPTGSRTVIVGASGSGKTTLLRAIAGFETPEAGTIALSNRVLYGPGQSVPPHRRNIAYVAQEGALFPHMSVADNVGFAMPRRAEDRQRRIDELLEKVGLTTSMRDRRPHELSGGQQQRVALARALAQQPELMLLDEPFASLDTGLREAMRSMVGDVLRDAGITALLVTHDRAEALAFADHLVVMRAGHVADAGPPQRLYQQPADRETAQFLGEAIILSGPVSNGQAQTVLGAVTVRHADAEMASVMVRPEQLRVATAADAQHKAVTGRVLRRSYRGSHWQLDIACGALEQPMAVNVPAELAFEPGAEIYLSVIGEGHVLPD